MIHFWSSTWDLVPPRSTGRVSSLELSVLTTLAGISRVQRNRTDSSSPLPKVSCGSSDRGGPATSVFRSRGCFCRSITPPNTRLRVFRMFSCRCVAGVDQGFGGCFPGVSAVEEPRAKRSSPGSVFHLSRSVHRAYSVCMRHFLVFGVDWVGSFWLVPDSAVRVNCRAGWGRVPTLHEPIDPFWVVLGGWIWAIFVAWILESSYQAC